MQEQEIERVVLLVMDSAGIGELPDAAVFGDSGSNTLKNVANAVGGLTLPVLESLGLGLIEDIRGVEKVDSPKGFFGKMMERSNAKDTTSGHWEMMGVVQERPFPVYPKGFPQHLINEFENRIRLKTLGNYAASGTEIIRSLGDEHIRTGFPIVYTSADSVFQIAAHEDIIPVERLYDFCRTAREMLTPPHNVGRVIARPFAGKAGEFKRTKKRKDFSLSPPCETVLDKLKKKGVPVAGIGKIGDIFCDMGLTDSYKTSDNKQGFQIVDKVLSDMKVGLIFSNFVDFDMLYGHRNDPAGYASSLEDFDNGLSGVISRLQSNDLLIITADHGCDPTTEGTDHSREFVPLIVFSKNNMKGEGLGVRETFADVGATILDIFHNLPASRGKSFLSNIFNKMEG